MKEVEGWSGAHRNDWHDGAENVDACSARVRRPSILGPIFGTTRSSASLLSLQALAAAKSSACF